jgi:glucose-6-phosphate isomerase
MILSYDDSNMLADQIGTHGVTKAEWRQAIPERQRAALALKKTQEGGIHGWIDLPFSRKGLTLATTHAKTVRKSFDRLVVVGIGGSDLGARTLLETLDADVKMQIVFLSNPDPETLAVWLQPGNHWRRTAINVVSKSGTTLETLSIFFALREALIKTVGMKKHAAHVYITTEPNGGPLHRYGKEQSYTFIPHPACVGGRFSVFSVVGLFPAACAGINISELLRGARLHETHRRRDPLNAPSAHFASLHNILLKRHHTIHVAMPYADRLRQMSFWYRQLWAESLGKDGKGPTPVAALGAVDQHSQVQLYNQGPHDKVFTFIAPNTYRHGSARVPKEAASLPETTYMSGKTFSDILRAQREGTRQALSASGHPNGTILLKDLSPQSVGELLQFYMTATAYMGSLMGVNPYDQPGVEAGKKAAKSLLESYHDVS